MNTPVLGVAVLLSLATFGLLAVHPEAVPVVTFLWQSAAGGACFGGLLALRRGPAADAFSLVVRWSGVGLALGGLVVLAAILS